MSEAKLCEFPTGTAFSGPRWCGRPAKFVVRTDDKFRAIKDGTLVCGIHKRPATRYGRATCEPIPEATP